MPTVVWARRDMGGDDGTTPDHARLRRLRPHPRARGRAGRGRGRRPHDAHPLPGGDLLQDGPLRGVRRRRAVPVHLRAHDPAGRAVRRDPRLSLQGLPAQRDLRPLGCGHRVAGQLVGRRVGIAEYQLTANVWIRGILADFHNVPVNSVRYMTGGLHQPGREEKTAIPVLPEGIEIAGCPEGRTLSEMLVSGEIDALYTPRVPRPFLDHDPHVRRLFPDVREVEENYYRLTQIFPIMHVIVIRREVYQRNRWLASSLAKAFAQARDLAFRGLDETASLPFVLPWVYDEIGRVQALMGEDYWSYGLNDANVLALTTFLRYAREQGLARDEIEPRDLFAPETLASLTI